MYPKFFHSFYPSNFQHGCTSILIGVLAPRVFATWKNEQKLRILQKNTTEVEFRIQFFTNSLCDLENEQKLRILQIVFSTENPEEFRSWISHFGYFTNSLFSLVKGATNENFTLVTLQIVLSMKKQKKYNIWFFYKTGKNENFTLAALQIEVRDWDYFWSFGLSFYSGYTNTLETLEYTLGYIQILEYSLEYSLGYFQDFRYI